MTIMAALSTQLVVQLNEQRKKSVEPLVPYLRALALMMEQKLDLLIRAKGECPAETREAPKSGRRKWSRQRRRQSLEALRKRYLAKLESTDVPNDA